MYSSENKNFGKFIKRPEFGQIVKVYSNVKDVKHRYGIVQFVKEVEKVQIAVIKEIFEEINFLECDFFFEKRKVEFLVENKKLKNSIKDSKRLEDVIPELKKNKNK